MTLQTPTPNQSLESVKGTNMTTDTYCKVYFQGQRQGSECL